MSVVVFEDRLTQPSQVIANEDNPNSSQTVTSNGSFGIENVSTRTISVAVIFFGTTMTMTVDNGLILSGEGASQSASIQYNLPGTSIPANSTFQAVSTIGSSFINSINISITGINRSFQGQANDNVDGVYSIFIPIDLGMITQINVMFNLSTGSNVQTFSAIQIISPGGSRGGIRRLLCDPIGDDCTCHKRRTKKCTKCRRKHICKFCGSDPRNKYDDNNACVNHCVVATVNTNNGSGNCRTCGQR